MDRKYQYRMVQVPPNVETDSKENQYTAAAEYLESVVNENTRDGWEFYRVDSLGVSVAPGCFGALLGRREEHDLYYVITFRRPARAPGPAPPGDR